MAKVAKVVISPISLLIGDKATSALLSIAAMIPGPQQPALAAAAATFGTLAQMTAPKPIARGSPSTVTIDIEPPRPYLVGRVMTGGVMRHDVAYGPTLKKVPNPYRWQVRVLSGVGPIQGIAGEFFDFQPLGGFYTGFFATTQNLGQRPQTTALVPPYGTAPGWTSASKLSGCAHVGINLLFDRDGERFASGLPVMTWLCDGEKVYDPRQDSTFPGGSGPCRAGVESTYVYNANPACHAVTYALGRFQNGKRIFGLGQSVDAIDMPAIVDWANDCDANTWSVNMVLTEGGTGANLREQRVRNLDDLCAAGGGRWFQAGGQISFDWHRPRLSLATLTDEDILEAGGGTDAVRSVRDRMNGVRPQYISPDHNWQQITAAEIVGTTYRTEDGTPLTQVYPLNGVTNPTQAGQLASYAMADSRELGPIDLQASVKWRFYRPGDTITIDSSLVAYQGQAVINQRSLNPQSLAVSLSMKSETPGKHAFALGKVASPPPTPTLLQTPQERDVLAAAALAPRSTDVSDVTAPANANRVPFTRFEGGRGWTTGGAFSPTPFLIVFDGRYFIAAEPTFTTSNQDVFLFEAPRFQVAPNERLSVSGRVQAFALAGGAAPSFWQLYIEYYNAAGSILANTPIASGTSPVSEGTLHAGFSTTPSTAASAQVVLLYKSSAAGLVRMAILEPMVTSAAPNQTVHPPYTPGPNAVDGALPNDLITVSGGGILSGIGTANISVDNTKTQLQGLLSARPASGAFIGQSYLATDTKEEYLWSGISWNIATDLTATAQRTIEAQFPSIEIKQGEAGHTGNRTVTHAAKRGTTALTGGTWSLPVVNLGAGSASINSSTGTVTLSGIVQSGAYAARYTHTDGTPTDAAFPVLYIPTPAGGTVSAKTGRATSTSGVSNDNNWNTVLSLTVTGCPAGRVELGGASFLSSFGLSSGTGTADYEARIQLDGVTLTSVASQNAVSGGAISFFDPTGLFDGRFNITAGTRVFTLQLRRTSGTGVITATSAVLEVDIIAT